ncbi:hypothetical protein C2E23DRAFT_907054 [Lenzites betulinus]|nr:hypothetical protein C2E23DRAFT_907054 [Lenzites betulinus]
MAITKTITITGGAIGGSCDLTLAFVPKNADFNNVIPIAWQVFTLSDNGSFTWEWNDGPAAARVVVDPNTGIISADEYTPLKVGQSTDLLVDKSKRPPEYSFTAPSTLQQQKARVMNRTGGYVDIGAGFITDLDQPTEDVHPVTVLRGVADQSPGYVDYDPALKLWASLDFQQSELLDSSVNNVTPLWEGTLTQLTGAKVNITVKRVNGTLVADGPTSFVPSSLSQLNGSDRPYSYTAGLAFANPGIVSKGVADIVSQLFPLGYSAKFTLKEFGAEATLQLTLPPTVSCNKAELETLAAIDASPITYGKAYIKGHSGACLLSANNGLETWIDVNPATHQWFNVKMGKEENPAFNGTNGEAFEKAGVAAEANGAAEATAASGKAVRRKASAFLGKGDDSSAVAEADDAKFRSVRRGGARRSGAA